MEKINFTNKREIYDLICQVESERKRLHGWALDFKKSNTESGKKAYSENIHRCQRLAIIRNELENLAETYS